MFICDLSIYRYSSVLPRLSHALPNHDMFLPSLLPYKHTTIHLFLSAAAVLFASLISLHSLLLYGINTYIHPENIGQSSSGGFRAAIRRPSDTSDGTANLKKRTRSKSSENNKNYEFDEANAQLFRLCLVDSHLRTRLYFPEYRTAFLFSLSALSSVSFFCFFPGDSGFPWIVSLLAISYLFISLGKLSFERSATKSSEMQIAGLFGFIGFIFALIIEFSLSPSVFDFRFVDGGNADGVLLKTAAAIMAGCLAGILFVPATRAARSLWIGTDQLQWNMGVISCGFVGRSLLYVSFMLNVFAVSLWTNPVTNFPVTAVSTGEFYGFRVWCLLGSAISQVLVLRPNLQMYLNEAVLSWYQRLHSSKVPDMDFGRAKIFLHNYYLCLAVLQFFVPPMLVLLLLGLSQMRGNTLSGLMLVDGLGNSSLVKEVLLFLAWWIVFVWASFMTLTLALLRCGFLFIN